MDILAMSRRIPLLGFFGSSASDDDFADRLNYKYTVAILVVFAFIVTNKHFGHNQINCWVPALFSKNFEEYTNLVCWITNTYYIPFDKQIPSTEPERRSTELRYYQWVAYILLFLSLLFYLPRIIWRTLSHRSGVDIKDIIEASHDFKSVSKLEKNRKMMEYMIGTIDQYVDDPRRQRTNRNMSYLRRSIALMCFMFGKFLGNYLVILYLFVKILYIANCVGQLFLISILLGRNYYVYGASIFRDIIEGKGYADSEYFPRVTMCKFQVRELGLKNFSHEYNVQCVLPINLFNQQIFTFLWFWYLILLVINTSALLIWVYRFVPRNQYNYAIRRVKLLRVRLMESSKLPKEHRGFRYSSSVVANEMESYDEKTAVSRIMNERDYEYSYDMDMEDLSNDKMKSNEPDNMFPNLPSNFNYESRPDECLKRRFKRNESKASEAQTRDVQVPIITEYDTYMSASSFCIKNYKEFVYEYLEADGMFMLRMIGSNSGDFVCTQVLHNLWKLFLFKKYTRRKNKSQPNDTSRHFLDSDMIIEETNYWNQEDLNRSSPGDDEDDEGEEGDVNLKLSVKQQQTNLKKKKTIFTKFFKEPTIRSAAPVSGRRIESNMNRSFKLKPTLAQSNRSENSNKTFAEVQRFQSIKRVTMSNKPRVPTTS